MNYQLKLGIDTSHNSTGGNMLNGLLLSLRRKSPNIKMMQNDSPALHLDKCKIYCALVSLSILSVKKEAATK
jgi:hypothetical protein